MKTRRSIHRLQWQTWWQTIRKPLIVVGKVIAVGLLIALVVAIIGGYFWYWDWTGINRYIGPVVKANQLYRSEKTLWDWLQLLIVPIMLAIGGFWLNKIQKDREQKTTKDRDRTERDIAQDNQRESALQTYINSISELLLGKNLRISQPEEEVRKIARVRTLTVLPNLDKKRKRSILQFLYESGLLDGAQPIVDLSGADLSNVDLSNADFSNANLSNADLDGAILSGANLNGAILTSAYLDGAKLDGGQLLNAHLNGAILSGANLNGAYLDGAILSGAYLEGACLEGAHLDETHLDEANLSDVNLNGADLRLANLTGAVVTQEQWEKAKSLKDTILPDGTKLP